MHRYISILLAGLLWLLSAATAWADDPPQITSDVIYGHKNGMALVMHVYRPAKPNGAAVIEIVSGGYFSNWQAANPNSHLVSRFLKSGYTVFSVFHGSNPKYTVPEIVEDMRLAVRFIRSHANDYGIDAARIGAIGSSAGGHLALMMATTGDDGDKDARDAVARASSRVAAVVAIAAPSDLRNFDKFSQELRDKGVIDQSFSNLIKPAFSFDAKLADSVSPVLHVTPDDAATMLIHGDADRLVPIEFSHRILAPLKEQKVPVELVVLPGVGHAPTGEEMKKLVASIEQAVDWFDKYLAVKQAAARTAGDYSFKSGGVKLHYTITGEGAPVVLVHGFTSSITREWERFGTIAKLSKGYQVIALDNRGHGQSEKLFDPKQYGAEMANDVLRLMDHLQVKQAHLVGYSLGGAITEYLLVNHPDRFFTATIGGMGWIKPDDKRVALIEEFAAALETGKGMGPLIEKLQAAGPPTVANPPKQIKQDYTAAIQMILTNNPKALVACLRGIPTLAVTEAQLKANKVPALSIIGGIDPWKATVDDMEKVMSNLKVKVIEGTDHATCLSSKEFADEIKTFLDAHSASSAGQAK